MAVWSVLMNGLVSCHFVPDAKSHLWCPYPVQDFEHLTMFPRWRLYFSVGIFSFWVWLASTYSSPGSAHLVARMQIEWSRWLWTPSNNAVDSRFIFAFIPNFLAIFRFKSKCFHRLVFFTPDNFMKLISYSAVTSAASAIITPISNFYFRRSLTKAAK